MSRRRHAPSLRTLSLDFVVSLGSHGAYWVPGVAEVAVGDRVAMPWLGYACGNCDHCVSGWETLCLHQENMGYSIDGGFGEYAVGYGRYVVKVPDTVDRSTPRR